MPTSSRPTVLLAPIGRGDHTLPPGIAPQLMKNPVIARALRARGDRGKAVTLIAPAIVGERTAGPGGALTVRTSHRQNGKRFRFCHCEEAFRILHSSFFSLQDSFISVPRPYSELPGKAQKSSDLSIGAYVGVTYLPVQSPAKYCRRK